MLISQPSSLPPIKVSQNTSSNHSSTLPSQSAQSLSSNGKRPHRDTIRHRARERKPREALTLFRSMVSFDEETSPNTYPFSVVLGCCARLRAVGAGKEIHGFMIRHDLCNRSNENSLVDFYAKCGLLSVARVVFDKMPDRNVVTWTIMMMAYSVKKGYERHMMVLFLQMLCSGVPPDPHPITVVMPHAKLRQGRQIHAYIVKNNLDSSNFVGTSLIYMYSKYGQLNDARLVLNRLEDKDIVCYNSLLSGLGKSCTITDQIELFLEMVRLDMDPTQSTFVSLLNGCAISGFIGPSRQFHSQAIIRGFGSEEIIQSAILDMYAKCGDLKSARLTFDKIKESTKNVVIWNAMIGGYGKHGHMHEALEIFSLMKSHNVKPNDVTFISLLSACSHAGWIEKGWSLFNSMERVYGVQIKHEHSCCMVDLLGRAGLIQEAYNFIIRYKCEYRPSAWGALLSACKNWGNTEIGEIACKRLWDLEPDNPGSYVGMSNIYAADNMWAESNNMREIMDTKNIKKDAGLSWIEIEGVVRKFRSGEYPKGETWFEEVYLMCDSLNKNMCVDSREIDSFVDWEAQVL